MSWINRLFGKHQEDTETESAFREQLARAKICQDDLKQAAEKFRAPSSRPRTPPLPIIRPASIPSIPPPGGGDRKDAA